MKYYTANIQALLSPNLYYICHITYYFNSHDDPYLPSEPNDSARNRAFIQLPNRNTLYLTSAPSQRLRTHPDHPRTWRRVHRRFGSGISKRRTDVNRGPRSPSAFVRFGHPSVRHRKKPMRNSTISTPAFPDRNIRYSRIRFNSPTVEA